MDAIKWLFLISIHNGIIYTSVFAKKDLRVAFEWNTIDFSYTNQNERGKDINSRSFIPENNIPFDFDILSPKSNLDSTIFVAIPRILEGVPATLGYIKANPNSNTVKNALITPYPSWQWHRSDPRQCNPQRIVSAYAVEIDRCQRLWVLDSGVINKKRVCPPQILIFDPLTNNLIHSYQIPEDQLKPNSILIDMTVIIEDFLDVISDCKQTTAYIADGTGNGLIVYYLMEDTSRVFYHNSFKPEPAYKSINIDGTRIDMEMGISSLAIASPYDKQILYHSLSSVSENKISSQDLKNGQNPTPHSYITINKRRSTQSSAMAVSSGQTVFFGSLNDCALKCWNLLDNEDMAKGVETLVQNSITLQFVTGLKVVKNAGGKEELWALSNRLHKALQNKIDPNDINFRIQTASVDDLIKGTKCQLK